MQEVGLIDVPGEFLNVVADISLTADRTIPKPSEIVVITEIRFKVIPSD